MSGTKKNIKIQEKKQDTAKKISNQIQIESSQDETENQIKNPTINLSKIVQQAQQQQAQKLIKSFEGREEDKSIQDIENDSGTMIMPKKPKKDSNKQSMIEEQFQEDSQDQESQDSHCGLSAYEILESHVNCFNKTQPPINFHQPWNNENLGGIVIGHKIIGKVYKSQEPKPMISLPWLWSILLTLYHPNDNSEPYLKPIAGALDKGYMTSLSAQETLVVFKKLKAEKEIKQSNEKSVKPQKKFNFSDL